MLISELSSAIFVWYGCTAETELSSNPSIKSICTAQAGEGRDAENKNFIVFYFILLFEVFF